MSTLTVALLIIIPLAPVDYRDIRKDAGFPAAQEKLEKYRKDSDPTRMRRHVWNVFRLLTEPADGELPVWMTWYDKAYVFSDKNPKDWHAGTLSYTAAAQFLPLNDKSIERSLFSSVLYNDSAQLHIRANNLHRKAKLDELLNVLKDVGGPDRTMTEALRQNGEHEVDFDRDAVVLKTIWWPIKKDGLTPLPVFDGIGYGADANYGVESWTRVVAVSPLTAPLHQSCDVVLEFNQRVWKAAVVPVDRFYARSISTDEDAARMNATPFSRLVRSAFGRDVQKDDYAVLVAMHMITKELPEWVWATFWWHDRPNEGPYARDRPCLDEPWNNYLMNQTTDRPTRDQHRINYNPWLEAPLLNGVRSNCISCHEQAGWRKKQPMFAPARPLGDGFENYFQDGMQTGFLWSIALEAIGEQEQDD